MERPQSIIWFERFYLGALGIGFLNTAFSWSSRQARLAVLPNSQNLPSWFVSVVSISTLVFGLAISLLLWHFVARRGSPVAKIFVVIFFVFGLLGLVWLPGLVSSVRIGLISPITALVSIFRFILNGAAVWMLFRPDTKSWFDKKTPDLTETFN